MKLKVVQILKFFLKIYKKLSTSGEIYISKKETLIIKFWNLRGLSIGETSSLVYIEDDEEYRINENIGKNDYIKKIKNN